MRWPTGRRYNAAMTISPTPPAVLTPDLASALVRARPDGLPVGLTVEDAQRLAEALSAAHAESTRTVYAHCWRVWERWCAHRGVAALPGDPAALAAYLVERAATGIAVTSLDLACTAIRYVHRTHGLPNPAQDELVRQVRLGLRRTYGTAPQRQARPLTVPVIRQILDAIDRTTPIGARDAAIILPATPPPCAAPNSSRLPWPMSRPSLPACCFPSVAPRPTRNAAVTPSPSPTAAMPPPTRSPH